MKRHAWLWGGAVSHLSKVEGSLHSHPGVGHLKLKICPLIGHFLWMEGKPCAHKANNLVLSSQISSVKLRSLSLILHGKGRLCWRRAGLMPRQ